MSDTQTGNVVNSFIALQNPTTDNQQQMFGRFAKQDNRFQASEWSPGYFVSTTSRAKGLPPARHDPSTNKRGKETVQYNHMLMTARSRPPGHDPYARMKPKPPQKVQHEATSLGGIEGMQGLLSPLRSRVRRNSRQEQQQQQPQHSQHSQHSQHPQHPQHSQHPEINSQTSHHANQSSRYHTPANINKHVMAHDNTQDSMRASMQVKRKEVSQSAQEQSLRLISARGNNPFVVPLQKIVDLRTGINQHKRSRNNSTGTPVLYNDTGPIYDGTLARDPSAEFTLDIDGDGDVDPDEQAHADKVGKFEWVEDLDQRAALRIYEGKVVLAGVFINQYRHDMGQLEPSFAKLSSREMTNAMVESSDFSEWLDALKERAEQLPDRIWDTDSALDNYLDIDGDGAIDADELVMQHRIGKFEFIQDPIKRTEARLKEGQYIYALDFLWNNRDIMWVIDRTYGTMNQKEILDHMLNQPDYQMMLSNLRCKASACRLGGSKQLRACLGGSKNYIPDKAQLIQRRIQELNHAARENAQDYICEKVDLEETFRKKNLGYSTPSGWGNIYMANLSMLRGGTKTPGMSLPDMVRQRKRAESGISEVEYVAF